MLTCVQQHKREATLRRVSAAKCVKRERGGEEGFSHIREGGLGGEPAALSVATASSSSLA